MDEGRYKSLSSKLQESSWLGKDKYPTTVAGMYALLTRHSGQIGNRTKDQNTRSARGRGNGQGWIFAQTPAGSGGHDKRSDCSQTNNNTGRASVAGKDGNFYDIICYNCDRHGHISYNCPEVDKRSQENKKGYNLTQVQFALAEKNNSNEDIINENWILLNTCSTVNVCRNASIITDIRTCNNDKELTIVTNGGSQDYNQIGFFKYLPIPIYYNPKSIANILSFKEVASVPGICITMDTLTEKAIFVLLPDGRKMKFKECEVGLYYFNVNNDLEHSKHNNINKEVKDYSQGVNLLSTVAENKSIFSKREIQGAKNARDLQQSLGWPSTTTYKSYVKNNLIRNRGITVDDIERSVKIYGTPVPLLKGKMTNIGSSLNNTDVTHVPPDIIKYHQHIQIYMDFFYVNKMPFLHTKSDKLNYLTVIQTKSRSKTEIINELQKITNMYKRRGFLITKYHGDNEFNMDDLKEKLRPGILNICANEEHVHVIERSIRTIKERCRCACYSVTYKRYTRLMTKNLVEGVIGLLNNFPSKNGVSQTMNPSMIVTGAQIPNYNVKRIVFGSYAQVHLGTTNTMKHRSVPAIALRSSNENGGHYFMSLFSGKRIHSHNWTELPIDDDVIARVKELASKENQPELPLKSPIFEWAPGIEIESLDGEDETESNSDAEVSLLDQLD